MNTHNDNPEPRNGPETTQNGPINECFNTTDFVDLDDLPIAGLANHLAATSPGLKVQARGDALEVDFRLHGMRLRCTIHITPQPDEAIGCRGEKRLCLSARIPLRQKEGEDNYDSMIHFAHEWNARSEGPRFVFRELQSQPPGYSPLGVNFDTLVAYWDLPRNTPVHSTSLAAMLHQFVDSVLETCEHAYWERFFARRGGSKGGAEAEI